MSDTLRFDNFSPITHGREGIYEIGADDANEHGVALDMAETFGYDLALHPDADNLGGFTNAVAPSRNLQENIKFIRETIEAQGMDPVDVTRSWAQRSGLLNPVERLYSSAEARTGDIDLVVITDGVYNWMNRREKRLSELSTERAIGVVLLAGGTGNMNPKEADEIREGMQMADYMQEIMAPRIGATGLRTELARADSNTGDEVMRAAIAKSQELVDFDTANIMVVSNAATWVLNGGQYLRAAKDVHPAFDSLRGQFEVVSDTFSLGTGVEPTLTHQNPMSAVGAILRNLQEFTKQS